MQAAGVRNASTLDELENHLREEVERQRTLGAPVEKAFATATELIGQPGELRSEFAKAAAGGSSRLRRFKTALLNFVGIAPGDSLAFAAAQEILQSGQRQAFDLRHDFIGTEHLLLALLESSPATVPAVLQSLGVDQKMVRRQIELIVTPGLHSPAAQAIPLTPRAKKALALAVREAAALHHTHVGAGHIFLGLISEGSGVAALVMKTLGVDLATARSRVARELASGP